MPISKQNYDTVLKTLKASFGAKNVEGDTKALRVTVDNKDRNYRKGLLRDIQNTFKSMGASYTPQGTKTGSVKISGLDIQVKSRSTKETGDAKFKPSDINPSIVDVWLTPQDIIENVTLHVQNQDISDQVKQNIISLLKQTAKDSNSSIPFNVDKKLVPSEFFEVLTSVKLAILLKSNDSKIRKTLGIPKKMDLSKSKIKILIPARANMPLLDYYISISPVGDSENSLKISVKSKVSSPKSNTIKFTDAFKDVKEVMDWYNQLQDKAGQRGQKIIAEDSVGAPANKGLLYPLTAVSDLIKKDKRKISNSIESFLPPKISVDDLGAILSQISNNISSLNKNTQIKDLKLTENQKLSASIIMQKTLTKLKDDSDYTVGNLSHLCEKILEKSSPGKGSLQEMATKYNFYQMFFDRVLKDRRIAYAVASISGKTLNYNFYSLVNFAKEYKDWIGLRTKNSVNNLSDKLGMDV